MSNQPDIRKNVLEKIRAGEIKMRPRSSFMLQRILIGISAALVLAASLLALSFAFFSVKTSGAQYLLLFGTQGLQAFLSLFPWTSLILFLLLIVALEFLVRRFTSAYRFPVLRVFGAVLFVGLAGSALLDVTPLHYSIFRAANTGQLPALTPLYGELDAPRPEQGLYSGEITSIGSSTITISKSGPTSKPEESDELESAASSMLRMTQEASQEETWTIVPPAGASPEAFSVGEKVYVGGHDEGGVVRAYGIHMESQKGKNKKHERGEGGEERGEKDAENGSDTEDADDERNGGRGPGRK
ncbi:hypothetical protein HYV30_01145 [Candidatus Kaiserbacteria bacterium]|nr:hypothetical protein [Candidatus Kaiserbacteria bacterium]